MPVLAIDQGTTSSRAIIYDDQLNPMAISQRELTQIYPGPGKVEHDPQEIWQSVVDVARRAISEAGLAATDIAAIGITNQRETTIIWDRETGRPIANAIVWQDRRTADHCQQLRQDGLGAMITEKTGLLVDPYFSATKITWLLDHVDGARTLADQGRLAFGTIDTWLIWNLTGGAAHKTDATNASRTMLFNIHDQCWDQELLQCFDLPAAILPSVEDCCHHFGLTEAGIFGGEIPILGVAGDQQAASIGQCATRPGMMKSTYGTGCFALLNTGSSAVASHHQMLTTIACRLDGKASYALEGSIFIAGAVVQWLRDGLGLIRHADESGTLAEVAEDNPDLVVVPAFTGLGAPWWKAECRGAIYGLGRETGPGDLARAALRSVAFQTLDLLEAMQADWARHMNETSGQVSRMEAIRVDGGMAASDWAMQGLADILNLPVDRPIHTETTAMGAARLAGMQAGVMADFTTTEDWQLDRRFTPGMDAAIRVQSIKAWRAAIQATITAAER